MGRIILSFFCSLTRLFRLSELSLVLACILLPLSVLGLKTFNDRTRMIEEATQQLEATTGIFEYQAADAFKIYSSVTTILNENIRNKSDDEIKKSVFTRGIINNFTEKFQMIYRISIINKNVELLLSNHENRCGNFNYMSRDYFLALSESDLGFFVGNLMKSNCTENIFFNVARRKFSADGKFDGVIVVSVLPVFFENLWRLGTEREPTAIVHADGRLLARFPRPADDLMAARSGPEIFKAAKQQAHGTYLAVSPIDGVVRLVSFSAIAGSQAYIVHSEDWGVVLNRWRQMALRDAGLSACAIAGLLILALIVIRRGHLAERAKIQLTDQTLQLVAEAERRSWAEGKLSAVLHSFVERQEEDHRRIARDLHDGLGQLLTILHLGLNNIFNTPGIDPGVASQINQLKATTVSASEKGSRLAKELRPVGLQEMGFKTALLSMTYTMSSQIGIPIDCNIDSLPENLPACVEDAMYRIAQEAVTNITRHAHESYVAIMLSFKAGALRMIIEDDGIGFAFNDSLNSHQSGHFGLLGMRERVAALGGMFEIETAPGRGTTLFITVPI